MIKPDEPQSGGSSYGYQILSQISCVNIKEKYSKIEAITGIEMNNAYKVCTPDGALLFEAKEDTSCCERNFCIKDCGPWRFDIWASPGPGQPKIALWHAERPCSCTCACFNRPVMTVTDCTTGVELGSVKDPWACCDLTFSIRDPSENTVLNVTGGCCQCGLFCPLPCGPCSEVEFDIKDKSSGSDVGHITKKVPGCCKFCFTDADNYELQFGQVQNPQWKVLLICLAIFLDFRYFDSRNEES
eukprot:GHVL01038080.1.p1 GENE.GHVL01038080.1~~GHVL01038080.1.p1  ORF type:complete len:243 (+),score=17.49 GHVL01038080.1:93-821(+)